MKKFINWIKPWFAPVTDTETTMEIYTLNIRNIHYVSLVVGIVQLLSLLIYTAYHFSRLGDSEVFSAVIRVGLSVILCLFGFAASGRMMKHPDTVKNHTQAVRFFIGSFICLLILWGMYVAVNDYTHDHQLLTFYTVELVAVLFVKLKPQFTTFIILGSYIANYLILNLFFTPGKINPYNYLMLALLSAAGAMINYRLTVNYIAEKNKANRLNDALEIIANYDSLSRLQNRYALNQHIPDFIGANICVAMGDVNNFKKINDTYGHRIGDDVLRGFAEILLDVFPGECVYRYGGDEFLVVMPDCDMVVFLEKFKEVNARFARLQIEGISHELGCSFGCVRSCPQDIAGFFDMITQADKNLYLEKKRLNAGR